MPDLDAAWVAQVRGHCDPVFAAADVGFVFQAQHDATRRVSALLWEADPRRFASRYPDSGIIETYGDEQWPGVHCIDYWVYLDPPADRARLSVEGWNLPQVELELSGHGGLDGARLAAVFARWLAVDLD